MRLHALGNLLLIIGFFAPAARAADVPAEFAITGVTYRGSGCPDGSLTYSISEDRKAFTFLFDRFTIETGPNNPSLQTMAGCSIVASTKYPAGWSFAIANVVYRGFAVVEAPLVLWFGRLIVVDSTARGRIPQPVYQELHGPIDGDFQLVGAALSEWSSCINRTTGIFQPSRITFTTVLDFNRVPIASNGARGFVGFDSLDGDLAQRYNIVWRRCP